MKKFKIFLIITVCLLFAVNVYGQTHNSLTSITGIKLEEITAPSGDPDSGYGSVYVVDSAGTMTIYFEDDVGTATSLIQSGSPTALDDITDPDANTAIDLTDYYISWDSGDTDHDLFNYQGTGAFGDISVMRIEQVTGNATDGTVLEVVAADANVDPLVVSASGKANALVVGQNTGVITIAGVAEGTNSVVMTAGDLTLTDGDLIVGGDVLVTTDDAAADQFKVNATGTIDGDAINFETSDGGIMLNADGSDYGDIELNSADDMTLTSAGNLAFSVTGTIDMNANRLTDVDEDYEAMSAADTITTAECGKTFYIGGDPEYDLTLPTAGSCAGCVMRFVLTAAPSGANYRVETGNSLENIIYGSVVVDGAAVPGVQEDSINFVDGAAAIGDWAEIRGDGTNWYLSGMGEAAGSITLTTQD